MKDKLKTVKDTEDGILTTLFRKIIFETGLVNSLGYYINRYAKTKGKKNKATIVKTIVDGEMTWKSFIFLIFEVLRAKKIKLKITVEHTTGLVSEHEVEVYPPSDEEENEDGRNNEGSNEKEVIKTSTGK